MGNCCCPTRRPSRKIVLLLLGLDNAGKTVAVKNLTGETNSIVMPTVGFSVVDLKYSSYNVKVFDLGGKADFRDVWHRYFVDAHGIIFVIDASDHNRFNEAHNVLKDIASHPKIQNKPILVLANKQDNDEALDEIDLIDKLDLESLANDNECPTFITSCSAQNTIKLDVRIRKGYDWLMKQIINEYPKLQQRVEADVKKQLEFDEEEFKERLQRIRLINEEEQREKPTTIPLNGTVTDDSIAQNNPDVASSSSKSTEIESIQSTDNAEQDIVGDTKRPESATSLIRKQLELRNLKQRSSWQIMHNKTAPMQVFGSRSTRRKAVKSATTHRNHESPDSQKTTGRRHLRSAGDSIFIVSRDNHRMVPFNDGGGDLLLFQSVRRDPPVRQFSFIKDVLPPINDVNMHTLQNGNYF